MSLYDRGRATASRLLEQYAQGVITYRSPAAEGTGDPWNPQEGAKLKVGLNAVAQGVEFKYQKPGYIESADVQVTISYSSFDSVTVVYTNGDEREFTHLADGVNSRFEWFFLPRDLQGAFEPGFSASGTIEIDGKELQIIEVQHVPAAGTPVVWRVFCRA